MNLKGMIVSIVTAMLVMTMFASSAMAITVDGVESTGEWATSDKLIDDIEDGECGAAGKFNISSMWAHYDAGKMYFRLDTFGAPPASQLTDMQYYTIHIDFDRDGNYDGSDYTLIYSNDMYALLTWAGNSQYYTTWPTHDTGATVSAAHGSIVEFEMPAPADGSGFIDPANFCVSGWADDNDDGLGEDNTSIVCRAVPVVTLDGNDVCLGSPTQFTSTASATSPCSIVTYKWDFNDEGTYELVGTDPSPSWTYTAAGTYTVKLTVVDDCGLEGSNTTDVTVYEHPKAGVSASPSVVEGPGGNVVFSGSIYDGTPPYTYEWVKGGSIIGSGTGQPTPVTLYITEYTTVTLNVLDDHGCPATAYDSASTRPPQEVPLLTLPGLLALIGMMCIVGAGRIITKGRRL